MLKICEQLFSQWNEKGIRYCHWKSNEHLGEGLDGLTDLDVYVYPYDREKAERILSENDYLRCRVQPENDYPDVCEWMGFDLHSGKLIHVHLHYEIITGTKFNKEYVFPVSDFIISTRIMDKKTKVYITDPNLEIIILLMRIALKAYDKRNISVSEESKKEILYLKERINIDQVKCYCEKLLDDRGPEFYDFLMSDLCDTESWYRIYLLSENWLHPYRRCSKLRVFILFRYYSLRRKFIQIMNSKFGRCIPERKTLPEKAIVVCFLGQDGSGKSTVSKDICNWLNWKLSARCFYLGSGDEFYYPWQKKMLKILNGKGMGWARPIRSWLYFSYLLGSARYVWKTVKRANSYAKRGGFAILDRYPQNQFPGINDGPKIRAELFGKTPKILIWVARWYAAREEKYLRRAIEMAPPLIFKLMLSPEESLRRKPFENLELIKRKHEIIQQLKFPFSEIETVDAEQPYAEELLIIKQILWRELLK